MLLTSSWIIDLTLLLFTAIFIFHKYCSRHYDYWKKRGVFYIKPKPFFGNIFEVITLKTTMTHWQQNIYNSSDEPCVGAFVLHQPVLTLRSPKLIKEVLIKHFDHFVNRTILAPDHDQVFASALMLSKDDEWKLIRSKITPAFTSGKLKAMFHIVKEIGQEMNDYVKRNLGQLEAKNLSTKYSAEVIARTVFGIKAYCFHEEDSNFENIVKLFFDFNWKIALSQSAYFFMHGLANFFHLEFVDKKAINYIKDVFWHTIRGREKSGIKGNDLIDIMVELRKNKEFCSKNKFGKIFVQVGTVQSRLFSTEFQGISIPVNITWHDLLPIF